MNVVYFVRSVASGLIKIGWTANLKQRLANLSCIHGEIEVLALISGGRDIESVMHLRFAPYWIEGEWFRPDIELVSGIGGIAASEDAVRFDDVVSCFSGYQLVTFRVPGSWKRAIYSKAAANFRKPSQELMRLLGLALAAEGMIDNPNPAELAGDAKVKRPTPKPRTKKGGSNQ